jgi:glycine cleavage system H protein
MATTHRGLTILGGSIRQSLSRSTCMRIFSKFPTRSFHFTTTASATPPRFYTRSHEWVSFDQPDKPNVATVGISDYAQEKLGELVYVALPEVGKALGRGAEAGTVESVKAATEVYNPLPGSVVSQNTHLLKEPTLINKKPYTEGWMYRIETSSSDSSRARETPSEFELLDEAGYKQHCDSDDATH